MQFLGKLVCLLKRYNEVPNLKIVGFGDLKAEHNVVLCVAQGTVC